MGEKKWEMKKIDGVYVTVHTPCGERFKNGYEIADHKCKQGNKQ